MSRGIPFSSMVTLRITLPSFPTFLALSGYFFSARYLIFGSMTPGSGSKSTPPNPGPSFSTSTSRFLISDGASRCISKPCAFVSGSNERVGCAKVRSTSIMFGPESPVGSERSTVASEPSGITNPSFAKDWEGVFTGLLIRSACCCCCCVSNLGVSLRRKRRLVFDSSVTMLISNVSFSCAI